MMSRLFIIIVVEQVIKRHIPTDIFMLPVELGSIALIPVIHQGGNMSLPERNNPYTFNEFIEWRNSVDYYADDHFVQKVLKHFAGKKWEEADTEARKISEKASFRWRDMSTTISWPEKRPYMVHFDGHHNRIDRIVRPLETVIMENEIFGERLFSDDYSPWVKLIRMLIIYQNGEACIACPVTCTEGLVKLLEKYADTPETKKYTPALQRRD